MPRGAPPRCLAPRSWAGPSESQRPQPPALTAGNREGQMRPGRSTARGRKTEVPAPMSQGTLGGARAGATTLSPVPESAGGYQGPQLGPHCLKVTPWQLSPWFGEGPNDWLPFEQKGSEMAHLESPPSAPRSQTSVLTSVDGTAAPSPRVRGSGPLGTAHSLPERSVQKPSGTRRTTLTLTFSRCLTRLM